MDNQYPDNENYTPVQQAPPQIVKVPVNKTPTIAKVVMVILFICLLFSGVLILGLVGIIGVQGMGSMPLQEQTVAESNSLDKILQINISGIIAEGAGLFSAGTSPEIVKKQLKQAEKDYNIKAVIIKINSPGGGVTASDEIYNAIEQFKKKTKKPVVAFFSDIAASGGYYVAANADEIVASPTSITGSIGVIIPHYDLQKLYKEKLGIESVPIKSAAMKDILSESRDMTEDEKQVIQGIVDQMYDRFRTLVQNGRGKKLVQDKFDEMTDGRIFLAEKAQNDYGLVDKIGYFEDAVESAKALANISDAKVIKYFKSEGLFSSMSGSANKEIKVNIDILKVKKDLPKFMYAWREGLN